MSAARPARSALYVLFLLSVLMFAHSLTALDARASSRVSQFKLSNGMQVVVVPDNRAPVVTHMVWYRVGAADEPRGVSGIAHFLEHLMFKSTEKIAVGEFSKIVARLGGQDNAFTGHDVTAYFQRVTKDRLATVMGMEADRMVNLRLDENEVVTERAVILEERRSRIENSPGAILDEQMSAALYQNHPYGIPVIGWMHEMAKLSRADALDFYKQHYAPNNAVLVVAGDVDEATVRTLAEQTYGKVPANPAIKPRQRVAEPPHRAPRRIELRDPRAGNTSITRYYLAPSYMTAEAGEAEALDLLMKIAAQGTTSRLYQALVVNQKIASSASGWYSGGAMDSGKIGLSAVLAPGSDVAKVEAAMDAVLAEIKANGVTAEEVERGKKAYLAEYIYESDNQSTLARRYGWGMVLGRSVAEIDQWPADFAKVTAEQVKAVANKHLNLTRSVTGVLIPSAPEAAPPRTGAASEQAPSPATPAAAGKKS
jgi:zinc protease